jgi:hypothetical protein
MGLDIQAKSPKEVGRISRRRSLQIGILSWLGLDIPALASLRRSSSRTPENKRAGNSCVLIFLFGGPSHIDLWDMKPDAPKEVRGEFQPISTNIPGVQICEHLPILARQMDKICLLRSMTHHMNVHGPACSELYTGREYFGPPVTDQARPEDWPSLSAIATRFGRSQAGVPNAIVLPWYTQFEGQDRRIAGQTGGRMGEEFNPFLLQANPAEKDFQAEGLHLPQAVSQKRFQRRGELLDKLDAAGLSRALSGRMSRFQQYQDAAQTLVQEGRLDRAFQLEAEAPVLRERYGPTRFGQSLLLARRLVEAGVSLVTVNWDDDHKDDKVSPHWDTHVDNFPKLKERLCPPFDRALATFVEDLSERGLLESTLVVVVGEFGRTPKVGTVTQNNMTKPTGRDHWPHAFTAILAGGGVRGGQVYGQTVANGGYVKEKPISPADLSATILDHLGIDPSLEYYDRFLQVQQRLSVGRPIRDLA